jgi:hypothetical protein
MQFKIKITRAEILGTLGIICFLAIFFYIVFQLPKMSKEQKFNTGLVMIIAVILFAVVFGQLTTYLENRKQKKLTQWMHEEKKIAFMWFSSQIFSLSFS